MFVRCATDKCMLLKVSGSASIVVMLKPGLTTVIRGKFLTTFTQSDVIVLNYLCPPMLKT